VKILHVTPHYHPAIGGAETQMKEVSERLARRGHDVTVLAMNSWGAATGAVHPVLPAAELVNQVNVRRFTPAARVQTGFNTFLGLRGAHRVLNLVLGADRIQMLAAGPLTWQPARYARALEPDVVAVSNWYCSLLMHQMLQARQRSGAFALIGIPLFHTAGEWSQSPLYGRLLNGCDAVLALTDHERAFIAQRSRQNAHVVGVGVDPAAFARASGAEIRRRYAIGEAPLVGYVGRMTESKGVATLIAAMKGVWQSNPSARLLLAGPGMQIDGAPPNAISSAMAGLSAAERTRIIMLGRFRDDEKASIFDALDLFAMPSVAESFGIAYLEAWMLRKAVIGSRIGSTACVIAEGVDGVLVAPGNSEELAQSIVRLLSDPGARAQMGLRGYAKTMAHFTWDAITDKIERIYLDAHRNSAGRGPAGSDLQSAKHRKSGEKCA
jgi:glycosyltransferase involved in cell wall biosynthesis